METLAYLHLIEDFQNPETKKLNNNLSQSANKAAIGLMGTACTASIMIAPNAAFACNYHDAHYYSPETSSYQSDAYQSCGCSESEQPSSYDYSQGYSYDYSQNYSYYSPAEYSYEQQPYYETGHATYTEQGLVGTNTVVPGDGGPFVATLQSVLAELGYYAGPIDGVYGAETFDAIAWYQIENGLLVDGIAGGQTLDSLGLAGYGA